MRKDASIVERVVLLLGPQGGCCGEGEVNFGGVESSFVVEGGRIASAFM